MKFVIPFFTRRRARKRRERERIGELDYVRWDAGAQFRHEYRVTWLKKEAASIESDPDAWIAAKLSLRNRHLQNVVVTDFIIAPKCPGLIAVRGAHVATEHFQKEEGG